MHPKKNKAGRKPTNKPAQTNRGMPDKDRIQEVVDFVSPQGVHYKILKTDETDAYDPPLPKKLKKS